MARETKHRKCDGVVCGHIHKAEIKMIEDVLYCNDGDWVESMTALVETLDGELKIVCWDKILREQKLANTLLKLSIESKLVETKVESE